MLSSKPYRNSNSITIRERCIVDPKLKWKIQFKIIPKLLLRSNFCVFLCCDYLVILNQKQYDVVYTHHLWVSNVHTIIIIIILVYVYEINISAYIIYQFVLFSDSNWMWQFQCLLVFWKQNTLVIYVWTRYKNQHIFYWK